MLYSCVFSCEKSLNPWKKAGRPQWLSPTLNTAASLSCCLTQGRRVSALKREGSSDPFLNPIISQAHPEILILDTATHDWRSRMRSRRHSRQPLYTFTNFFLPFNQFLSLSRKRNWLYNIIATGSIKRGFLQSKCCYKLMHRIIHLHGFKDIFHLSFGHCSKYVQRIYK